ncbi:MAG TPA: hypothetical protein VNK03_06085 [Gammaproteobacteria bacterium]|nr:hypothetical protein [Gammaproteobacteria bacterium]
MKKSPNTKTPKKDEVHKKSCKLQNELECTTKDFALDLKSWEESLTILGAHIDRIDKVVQKTATMTPQELSKEFSDTQLKLDKLKTKMEAQQKGFNLFQTKFEKTLAEPIKTVAFNGLKEETLKEVRENIQTIQVGITTNTQALNGVVEKSMEYTRKLILLEESVIKICLPDEMEKADKLNDSLMKRLTALCEMTAPTQLPEDAPPKEAPLSVDSGLVKSFSHLYIEHKNGKALLKRIKENMGIPLPEEKAVQPDRGNGQPQPKVNGLH